MDDLVDRFETDVVCCLAAKYVLCISYMSTHEIAEQVGSSWQMKVPSAALDMYAILATIVATVALSIDSILAQTIIRVEIVG